MNPKSLPQYKGRQLSALHHKKLVYLVVAWEARRNANAFSEGKQIVYLRTDILIGGLNHQSSFRITISLLNLRLGKGMLFLVCQGSRVRLLAIQLGLGLQTGATLPHTFQLVTEEAFSILSMWRAFDHLFSKSRQIASALFLCTMGLQPVLVAVRGEAMPTCEKGEVRTWSFSASSTVFSQALLTSLWTRV